MDYYYDSLKFRQNFKPLEYYGVIGNLETCALVGADGSIDWMCLPHLESPSVFGRLLDATNGGYFEIHPDGRFTSRQAYIERTNVLETHFSGKTGDSVLTDFMPPFKKRQAWHKHQTLFRRIKCLSGKESFALTFQPGFNYGKSRCNLYATDSGIAAETGKEKIYLDAPAPFTIKDGKASCRLRLKAGEEVFILLQYNNHNIFNQKQATKQLKATIKFWDRWAHRCQKNSCVFQGPWHDLAVRSGLVLKLLTHGETGSIAAAATTSLPETIGGVRNWDYRYNWIRDSAFTAQALHNLGHNKEARQLFNWYKRLYKGVKFKDMKIMHGLHGEVLQKEKILKNWTGYKNSKPVRVGNNAASQRQLDVYGELLNMAYETSRYGEDISKNDWRLLKKIVNNLKNVWRKKDAGLWETRSGYKHFVYSKVMCWVAVDRGIKISEKKGFSAPLEKWKALRQTIADTILKKGFNLELNSFVQAFGETQLDAASLLIPLVGFLPLMDSRVQGTIDAALKHLVRNGLVYRYRAKDGLPGREGSFILCSCWLVDALALCGRTEEAEKIYQAIAGYANPLGLLAEEISSKTGRQMGNFPQAFSHIGIINSALYLGLAKGYYNKETQVVDPAGRELINNRYLGILNLLNNK